MRKKAPDEFSKPVLEDADLLDPPAMGEPDLHSITVKQTLGFRGRNKHVFSITLVKNEKAESLAILVHCRLEEAAPASSRARFFRPTGFASAGPTAFRDRHGLGLAS